MGGAEGRPEKAFFQKWLAQQEAAGLFSEENDPDHLDVKHQVQLKERQGDRESDSLQVNVHNSSLLPMFR